SSSSPPTRTSSPPRRSSPPDRGRTPRAGWARGVRWRPASVLVRGVAATRRAVARAAGGSEARVGGEYGRAVRGLRDVRVVTRLEVAELLRGAVAIDRRAARDRQRQRLVGHRLDGLLDRELIARYRDHGAAVLGGRDERSAGLVEDDGVLMDGATARTARTARAT